MGSARRCSTAKLLNIKIVPVGAKDPEEFSAVFSEMKKSKVGGLVVLNDAMLRVNRALIIALAAESRLPAIYAPRDYIESGGLISYGACIPCNFRRSATYIEKILKGAKPGDLPVEQSATFEMVVNRKTAAGAWSDDSGNAARARQRGDRVKKFVAIAHSRLWH